jgi:hypothetical protein
MMTHSSKEGTEEEAHHTENDDARYEIWDQPENQLQYKTNERVGWEHKTLSKAMRWFREKKSS